MDCKRYFETIMKMVMPQTFPMGIKLLRKGDSLPEGAVRPGKFGIRIALCQWTNLARRWGWVVGAMAEDINCSPCRACFGFGRLASRADLARFIMDMGYFDSPEQASAMAEELDLLDPGEITGVVAFPMDKAPVDPDLLVVYGTPAQMTRLAYAYTHSYARPIHSSTTFGLSCLSMVLPSWKKEPALVHPGRGERTLAGTDDSEMLFTAPMDYAEGIVEGLEKTHRKGLRYPIQGYMLYEPPVIPPMKALEEKLLEP